MQKNGVLIAEDHELYGDGMAIVIAEVIPDAEVFRAKDIPTALEQLKSNPCITLVLLDLKMPGANGLTGIKTIKQSYPTKAIVVVSSLDFDTNVRNIMRLGVNGFISKSTEKAKMKAALLGILAGDIVVEPEVNSPSLPMLSERQQQTLNCMAQGKTNKEIARALNISPHTAKEYVSKVMQLLNADNRTQAVQFAEKNGLLLNSLTANG